MLGLIFALSVIHLAYDDFCRLTPDEYAAVCEAYHDHEETLLHDQWERMRLLATITIQPHVKGKVVFRNGSAGDGYRINSGGC